MIVGMVASLQESSDTYAGGTADDFAWSSTAISLSERISSGESMSRGWSDKCPLSPYPVRIHPDVYQPPGNSACCPSTALYITRGRGNLSGHRRSARNAAGTALLLFPGERHRYRPRLETGWDEYWVFTTATTPSGWFATGSSARQSGKRASA